MSWLNEQFALLAKFLSGGFRRTAGFCALGMAAAAILGAGIGLAFPQQAAQILNSFMEQVEQSGVIDEAGQMSVFSLLMNNWRAMLLSAAYGIIPFMLLPLISLLSNGVLLGVLGGLLHASGQSMLFYAAGILPHGIFELTALVLSIACGVTLCRNMCRLALSDPKRRRLLPLLEDLLRVLVLLVAPLTVAAAFVECYVTPVIMSLFL